MNKFPTNYDSFYNNLQIANKLTEFQKIKCEFRDRGVPFNSSFVGFTYLVELVIIHLLLNIETLIKDEYLLERVRWGEVTLEDRDLQNCLREHPEGKYIPQLNSIRRDLSKIRNSDTIDEKLLENKLIKLNEKLLEIDTHIRGKYSVKKIVESPEIEKKLLIENILLNYNYIKFDINFDTASNMENPKYPGHLVFYLMPDEQRYNYYLMNPRIKTKINNYLSGYVVSLEFLYSGFMPEKRKYFRKMFFHIKNWGALHTCYNKIYPDLKLEKLTNKQLFDYDNQPVINTNEKERIDSYSELRRVLRDRRTRLFDNFSLDESILGHYFLGALEFIERGADGENKTKLDLIEFRIDSEYERLVYFALFNPLKGLISDGSHWLFFKDNSEICSAAERLIHESTENNPETIQFRKYFIREEIVKKYLADHTYGYKKEKHKNEMLKSSRNITSELFALFYLMKENRDKKIIDFECHKDIPNTDIDVLVETDDKILIGQVKPYLSFDPAEKESILKNFDLITEHLIEAKKPFSKFLFLMTKEVPDSEIGFMIDDIPKQDMIPEDGFIETKQKQIIDDFTKAHINIKYLDDILEKFKIDGSYDGLVNQMGVIFIKKNINHFDNDSFLWE